MNTAVNANVVHESEAQRQHARVKIPAKLRFFGPDRTPLEARVLDLSAGGLAFNAGQMPLTIGQVYKARLQFVIDNLGIGMDVELQVRSFDRQTGRAGCPAIADPGASLVALAHEADIPVVPFVGPSSILLALMGSGLSGQNFSFHGYLPAKDEPRRRRIQELERESRKEQRTQLFIETPYRNRQMLQTLIDTCSPQTRICVASNLTLPAERILTRTAGDWKTAAFPEIDKQPTVFLLQA